MWASVPTSADWGLAFTSESDQATSTGITATVPHGVGATTTITATAELGDFRSMRLSANLALLVPAPDPKTELKAATKPPPQKDQ